MADSSPTPRSEQKQEIHLTLTSDQCDQALVCLAEAAKRSQQQVKQAMQNWQAHFRQCGVSKADIEKLSNVINLA